MPRKLSLEHIDEWTKLNRPEFRLCDVIYKGSNKKLIFYHINCEEYFNMNWDNFLQGMGCPVCRGFQVGEKTSLAYLRPDLVLEWHPDNDISPYEVTCGSGKKAWWICSDCKYGENKDWSATICNRTNGRGCPACSNPPKVLTDKNRLSVIYPSIALDWNFSKNKTLTPDDVSYGSCKNIYWNCFKCGNVYNMSVKNRSRGRGCPKCNLSMGERVIELFLSSNNISFISQKKFVDCKDKSKLSFDFGILCGNNNWILIEYQGIQHYEPTDFTGKGEEWAKKKFKELKRRDKIKQKYCKDNNIPLIIIPYWDFDRIEEILTETLL